MPEPATPLKCPPNFIITVEARMMIGAGREAGMSDMRDTIKAYTI